MQVVAKSSVSRYLAAKTAIELPRIDADPDICRATTQNQRRRQVAGRHGNKGVVARIMPVEDMPFMADGDAYRCSTKPTRCPEPHGTGCWLETHLGMAARALGYKVATPPFNGVPDEGHQ